MREVKNTTRVGTQASFCTASKLFKSAFENNTAVCFVHTVWSCCHRVARGQQEEDTAISSSSTKWPLKTYHRATNQQGQRRCTFMTPEISKTDATWRSHEWWRATSAEGCLQYLALQTVTAVPILPAVASRTSLSCLLTTAGQNEDYLIRMSSFLSHGKFSRDIRELWSKG